MPTLPIAAILYTPDINVEALLVRIANEVGDRSAIYERQILGCRGVRL